MSSRSTSFAPAPEEISFERLLHAIAPAAFFADYYGKKPLLIRRRNPDFFRRVFSLDDIDTFLYTARPRPGEFRISRAGEGVDLEQKDLQNLHLAPPVTDIYKQFVAGNTLVLHGVDMRWPPLATVIRMLEFACASPVTANAYLTPAGEQGYPTHYDTHDFFIFQLDGAKDWHFAAPDPANQHPIRSSSRVARREQGAHGSDAAATDVTIEAGDLMYVPRGWVHYARASQDASLHMTVGVHGATWLRLAEAGVHRLGHEDHRLRANIPLAPQPDGTARHLIGANATVLSEAFGRIAPRDAFQELQSTYLAGEEPMPDGHFRALAVAARIDAQTRIIRRKGVSGVVHARDDQAVLLFFDKRLALGTDSLAAFRYMIDHAAFTPRELPGLNESSAIQLVQELVRLGFLTIENAAALSLPMPAPSDPKPTSKETAMDIIEAPSVTPTAPIPPGEPPGVSPQSGDHLCEACAATAAVPPPPRFVYAIGRIRARFPNESIEKETRQVIRDADTADLTDSQVLYQILRDETNAYIAREMCWIMSVGGLDCYILQPRSGIELKALVDTLKTSTLETGIDAVIGTRSFFPVAPSDCNGVNLPTVLVSKVYSFDITDFVKQIPGIEGYEEAAREFLHRMPRIMLDNVGEADEHRAVNYLTLRYQAVYNLVAARLKLNQSLKGITASPTVGVRNRRVIDVVFTFVDRVTDSTEKFLVRVDVTGQFPFLVGGVQPVFDISRI
jgi:ribosomal protein L16 Arg81 hydroxylase